MKRLVAAVLIAALAVAGLLLVRFHGPGVADVKTTHPTPWP